MAALSFAVEQGKASVAALVFSAAECCSPVSAPAVGAVFVVEAAAVVALHAGTVAVVAEVAVKAWRAGMMILAAAEAVA